MTSLHTEASLSSSSRDSQSTPLKPGSTKKSLLWILLIIVLVAAVLALLKSKQPVPPISQKVEKSWGVDTLILTPQTLAPQLRLLGVVESPHKAELKAALAADIVSVIALEGQNVTKGAQLLQLDDQEARINLAQREADLAELDAQLALEYQTHKQNLASLKNEEELVTLAKRAVERESSLKKSNVTSAANMDIALRNLEQQQLSLQSRILSIATHENRVAQIKARHLRAQALKELAELDLARTRINAPFDGVITQVHRAPGERVRVGDPLITLYDVENTEVRAQIPASAMASVTQALAAGQTMTAQAQSYGQETPLELNRLSGEVNAGRGGVDAIFTLPSTAGNPSPLFLGQTIDVLLNLPELEGVMAVPVSALYGSDRLYQVKEGRLRGVAVKRLGTRFEGERQWLLIQGEALPDGASVITTQLPTAVNGLKVSPRDQGDRP